MAFDFSGFLTGGRIWPGFHHAHRAGRDLVVMNLLTNEVWEYDTVQGLLGSDSFFDFAKLKPSVYGVRNFADATLPVVLFGKSYSVHVGQEWRFVAHDEIGSHAGPWADAGFYLDGNQTRLTQSYWDRALGGSIWDNGASVWDLINS